MAHRFVRALDRCAQRVQSVNPHSPVIRRCRLCLRISRHGPRLPPHASGWKRRNRLDRPGQFIHALAYLVQRPLRLGRCGQALGQRGVHPGQQRGNLVQPRHHPFIPAFPGGGDRKGGMIRGSSPAGHLFHGFGHPGNSGLHFFQGLVRPSLGGRSAGRHSFRAGDRSGQTVQSLHLYGHLARGGCPGECPGIRHGSHPSGNKFPRQPPGCRGKIVHPLAHLVNPAHVRPGAKRQGYVNIVVHQLISPVRANLNSTACQAAPRKSTPYQCSLVRGYGRGGSTVAAYFLTRWGRPW